MNKMQMMYRHENAIIEMTLNELARRVKERISEQDMKIIDEVINEMLEEIK